MGFVPISINKFVIKHLENNPTVKEKDLRNNLNEALTCFKKGIKCSCGNDIWVIGSAFAGNSCFTCITGDSFPTDDYEIDSAIIKNENKNGIKHIDNIDKTKISGFFDDEGFEINIDLIKKPSICLTCINDDDAKEELLCNMTRYDQRDDNEFKCFAYKNKFE
jgi:hypothetical protein